MIKEIDIKTFILVLFAAILVSCAGSPNRVNHSSNSSHSYKAYNADKATSIVSMAKRMLGQPYRYGGSNPLEGFDCSGLVLFTHSQVSNGIPRVSLDQYHRANKVPLSKIKPGDLLFYKTGSSPTHVTIYIGNRQFIHAPSSGKKVMVASMDNPYFKPRLVKAGRLY